MSDSPSTLERVVIVDDDVLMADLVAELLRDQGAKDVKVCPDPTSGWSAIQAMHPTFVLLDWKMPAPGGLGLFNRIRQDPELRRMPVVVMSALLRKEDFAVIEEFPFTHYLSKPFTAAILEERLTKLQEENQWFSQGEVDVSSALELMTNNRAEALNQLRKMFSSDSRNAARLATLTAAALRRGGFLNEAEVLLRKLLQASPNSVLMLSELGRVLLLAKRYTEAEEILTKAQALSPKNADRLCQIGEAQLNQGKTAAAQGTFEKSLTINPDSERAQGGAALAKSMVDYFKSTPSDSVPRTFASMMNSMGIALVRQGRIQEGIKQYMSAALFCAGDAEVMAKLSFNLGLALLRNHKATESVPMFKQAWELSGGKFEKAKTFVELAEKVASGKTSLGSVTVQITDEDFPTEIS